MSEKKMDHNGMGVFVSVLYLLVMYAFLRNVGHCEQTTTTWGRWDIAPYASNQTDACKKASVAIELFSMPQAVKEHFKQVLGDCSGGKIAWLTPGEKLEQMMSGGAKPHVMKDVLVGELPVTKSPDGRTYRKGAVAETAEALEWSWPYEGKIYTLYRPEVCFNWSWASSPAPTPPVIAPPAPPVEKCVELSFNAPIGGKVRWGVASATGPLPPSVCNAQKQGDGNWTAWTGQCDECTGAIEYIQTILGDKADVYHKYLYGVTESRQTLRFSTSVWADVVYICLEDASGNRTCGVYERPQDWKESYQVAIPDELWKPDSDCPE